MKEYPLHLVSITECPECNGIMGIRGISWGYEDVVSCTDCNNVYYYKNGNSRRVPTLKKIEQIVKGPVRNCSYTLPIKI